MAATTLGSLMQARGYRAVPAAATPPAAEKAPVPIPPPERPRPAQPVAEHPSLKQPEEGTVAQVAAAFDVPLEDIPKLAGTAVLVGLLLLGLALGGAKSA